MLSVFHRTFLSWTKEMKNTNNSIDDSGQKKVQLGKTMYLTNKRLIIIKRFYN